MILYGSQTSPFVRRLRLLLPTENYHFIQVDIFNREQREQLRSLSPLLKIPILKMDNEVLWDSRVIFNELCKRGFHPNLKIKEENLITAISDVSDSLVQKLLASRSQVVFPPGSYLEISHNDRIKNTLNYLNQQIEEKSFEKWNFTSMALYCLVDWIQFRDLTDLTSYPNLLLFKEANQNQERISITDPRCKITDPRCK